jgi:hypothetical protein
MGGDEHRSVAEQRIESRLPVGIVIRRINGQLVGIGGRVDLGVSTARPDDGATDLRMQTRRPQRTVAEAFDRHAACGRVKHAGHRPAVAGAVDQARCHAPAIDTELLAGVPVMADMRMVDGSDAFDQLDLPCAVPSAQAREVAGAGQQERRAGRDLRQGRRLAHGPAQRDEHVLAGGQFHLVGLEAPVVQIAAFGPAPDASTVEVQRVPLISADMKLPAL